MQHHGKLKKANEGAAEHGEYVKYMNFPREDFKANHNGFGKPEQVQSLWLREMTNPKSKYLKVTDGFVREDLECLEGLTWDIWGNGAFTTVFKW